MTKAQQRVDDVLQKCKLSIAPINIDKIVESEGLNLDYWDFSGRVQEVYLGDSIGVKRTADTRKRRELIAHALGHHFLHAGNHFYFDTCDHFITLKQEHEAQCFAAELLMPSKLFEPVKYLPPYDLADYFDVPEELVNFKLKILKQF